MIGNSSIQEVRETLNLGNEMKVVLEEKGLNISDMKEIRETIDVGHNVKELLDDKGVNVSQMFDNASTFVVGNLKLLTNDDSSHSKPNFDIVSDPNSKSLNSSTLMWVIVIACGFTISVTITSLFVYKRKKKILSGYEEPEINRKNSKLVSEVIGNDYTPLAFTSQQSWESEGTPKVYDTDWTDLPRYLYFRSQYP